MDPKSTDPKSFSRKEFLVLTVTLVGGAALEANCSSSDDGTGTGGRGGTGSPGTAGTSGSAGTSGGAGTSGSAGTTGAAGTSGSAGTTGSAGTSGSAGTTGTAGTGGTAGGAGGESGRGGNGSAGTTGGGGGGAGGGTGGAAGGRGGNGGGGGRGGSAGGSGGAGGGGGSGGGACTLPLPETQVMVATTDSQLHTHTVTIDAAILNATTAQMVNTSSAGPTPGHTHMVMLTPGNLTTLRGGGMVDITSTNASQHTHTYRIRCT